MVKFVVLREVDLHSPAAQESGCADPYIVFKSTVGAPVCSCDARPLDRSPFFVGPFTVSFGGPSGAEQLKVEVWSHGRGAVGADVVVEWVVLSFDGLKDEGRESWSLSAGGRVTLSWHIEGRLPERNWAEDAVARVQLLSLKLQDLVPPGDDPERKANVYAILMCRANEAEVRWNAREAPEWNESMWLPYDDVGYRMDVWEIDPLGDVHVGYAEFSLDKTGNVLRAELIRAFDNVGTVSMQYKITHADTGSAVEANPVLLRKEIRKMSQEEQKRFGAALMHMMKNQVGPRGNEYPQSSQYYRVASYHGYPNLYCPHAQETFVSWHRAYCVEMEQALVKADIELGNDGNIGLPYWDWSLVEVNGECVPKIIRENFPELPANLVAPTRGAAPLLARGYTLIRSDAEVKASIESSSVRWMARLCLRQTVHWMFASTRNNRRGYPVEAPHNIIHVFCGYPMSDNSFASFHPLFFLHHCNVDRIYERFVQQRGAEACARDFQQRQQQLAWEGEVDRYRARLTPFRHPFTSEWMTPALTFNASNLGYVYDELPAAFGASAAEEEGAVAAFVGIKVLELEKKSFDLHVFVVPRGAAATWQPPVAPVTAALERGKQPQKDEEERRLASDGAAYTRAEFLRHYGASRGTWVWTSAARAEEEPPKMTVEWRSRWQNDAHYAGHASVFAGRGTECENCKTRDEFQPLTVLVELKEVLDRLKLKWYEAELKVICEDQFGAIMELGDTALPEPVIVGPPLSGEGEALSAPAAGASAQAVPDPRVVQLQRYLARFGYYTGALDGRFSPAVEAAVRTFQKYFKIPEDGVAGLEMKRRLADQRMDLNPDVAPKSDVPARRFLEGMTVRYAVGPPPGYLDQAGALADIAAAFKEWSDGMGLKFEYVGSVIWADLYIKFADLGRDAKPLDVIPRDGEQLAMTTPQVISLDAGERWLLKKEDVPEGFPKAVRLFPVVLHQIGHAVGLTHSQSPKDVMWPLYAEAAEKLSDADKERAKALVVAPTDEERATMTIAAAFKDRRLGRPQAFCRPARACFFR